MGYFFQDRDIMLNEHGVRKRVFHIVRAHTRKDGHTVPFHFRGLREFSWAGYDIRITVPGRDHPLLLEIDSGMVDERMRDDSADYLNLKQLGSRLAAVLSGRKHCHRKGAKTGPLNRRGLQ